MFDNDVERLERIMGDGVLVRADIPKEKVGSFYVPMNAQDNALRSRLFSWTATVVKWGSDAELEGEDLREGLRVAVDPVAKDCPSFSGKEGELFILVRDEDIQATLPEDQETVNA